MSTYKPPDPNRPIEELRAGDAFRDSAIERADRIEAGVYPLWHGWVIMDAFLAGIDWARRAREDERP